LASSGTIGSSGRLYEHENEFSGSEVKRGILRQPERLSAYDEGVREKLQKHYP
jgi:hypothetical protein